MCSVGLLSVMSCNVDGVVVLLFICILSVTLTQTGIILCMFIVFVPFVGVVSCYIYTFCFRVVTYQHMFISLDHCTLWEILRSLLGFNFLCQSVWFSTTVCKEEVCSVYSYCSLPQCSNIIVAQTTKAVSPQFVWHCCICPFATFPQSHRKCFLWVLQLGKSVVSSFWPTRCSAFPYCQKKVHQLYF